MEAGTINKKKIIIKGLDADFPSIKINYIVPARIKRESTSCGDVGISPAAKRARGAFRPTEKLMSVTCGDVGISPAAKRARGAFWPTEKLMSVTCGDVGISPAAKRARCAFKSTEKLMVINLFKYVVQEKSKDLVPFEQLTKSECAEEVSNILGISSRTVLYLLKEHEEIKPEPSTPPMKPGPKANFKDLVKEQEGIRLDPPKSPMKPAPKVNFKNFKPPKKPGPKANFKDLMKEQEGIRLDPPKPPMKPGPKANFKNFQPPKKPGPKANLKDLMKEQEGIRLDPPKPLMKLGLKANFKDFKPPKKPGPKDTIKDKMDDFTITAIRRVVHEFYHSNEHPTCKKVLQAVNDDPDLPNLSEATVRKLIKHLNFKCATKSGKSILIDKPEIIVWRQRYLSAIKRHRKEGRYIYYQDDTWVTADGLSTGLRNPTGNENRLIVSHIGGEEGFVEGGLLVFEPKRGWDYLDDDVKAECFEEWFAGILHKLKPNSVIVIDNAPYNSRKKKDTIPKMSWQKRKVEEWLSNKNIPFEPDMVKATLIELVKQKNLNYDVYAMDEMAKLFGITILRLPPYHGELNPFELIWAQVKGYIAGKNTTFKLEDVTQLFYEGIGEITEQKWNDCLAQVQKEEDKMCRLDLLIDKATDTFQYYSESDSESE